MTLQAGRLLRYAVVGLVTLGVYLLLGQLLHRLGVTLLWQACVSFLGAVAVNYVLQKTWVFEDRRPVTHTLPRYFVMIAFGAAINLAALAVLSLRWPLLLAQLAAVVLVVGWNALLSFCWVFLARTRTGRALHRS